MTSVDPVERRRRRQRKDAFHLAASRTRMPDDPDDLEYDYTFNYLTSGGSAARKCTITDYDSRALLYQVKSDFIKNLAMTGGDVQADSFRERLDLLTKLYEPAGFDARVHLHSDSEKRMEGMWLTLSQPNYLGSLGRYNHGYLYSLRHMSMGMIPSDLLGCIDGTFNPIHYVHTKDRLRLEGVPEKLKSMVFAKKCVLRSSDIVSALTIIPGTNFPFGMDATQSPNRYVLRPMRALLSVRGYLVPHPDQPQRLLAWFSHGSLEVSDDEQDQRTWRQVYERTMSSCRPLEADGKLSFQVPPGSDQDGGGAEPMFVDVLYLDNTIRVLRGNRGTIYVMARVPYFPDE